MEMKNKVTCCGVQLDPLLLLLPLLFVLNFFHYDYCYCKLQMNLKFFLNCLCVNLFSFWF